jgi:hypothetical protein
MLLTAGGIAQLIQSLDHVLDNWGTVFRFPEVARIVYLFHSVQTGCGAYVPPV